MTLGETAELIIHLVAKDDASKAIQGVESATVSLGTSTKRQLTAAGVAFGTFAGNIATSLSRRALGAVTDFVGGSIEAYKQQEIATAQLTTSLDANVVGWHKQQAAIDAAMKSGIALGFQDDDVAASLSRIVAATHDVGKGLDVLRVAEDLARFKGISLQDAAASLVKVEAGRYRVLADLGIAQKTFATQEEALAAVEKVATGQAIAYTDTYAGKEAVLTAKMNEQQELIGQKLVPWQLALNDAILKGITAVTDFANNYADQKQALVDTPRTNFLDSLPSKADVQAAIDRLKALPDSFKAGGANENPIQAALFDLNINGVKDKWQQQIDLLTAYLNGLLGDQANELSRMGQWKTAFTNLGETATTSIAAGMNSAMTGNLGRGSSVWANLMRDAVLIGQGTLTALTQGLLKDQSGLENGLSDLKDTILHGLTPSEIAAEGIGKKFTKWVQRGLSSDNVGAKEKAEHLIGLSIKAMEDAAKNGVLGGPSAKQAGKDLAMLHNAGMNSQALEKFLTAEGLTAMEIAAIKKQFPQYFDAGVAAAKQFNAGFNGMIRHAPGSGGAPPPSGGTTSGGSSGGTRVRALGGPVSGGQAYIVGERRPELFIPKTNGYILPSLPPTASPVALANRWHGMMGPPGLQQPIVNVTVILSAREVSQELKREYDLTNRRTR